MTNADRFAAALADWAVALEMPAPRRTAQGSSGGYHYEIDGHAYFLAAAPTIEALLVLGYVQAIRFGRASTEFGITAAGRAAVERGESV